MRSHTLAFSAAALVALSACASSSRDQATTVEIDQATTLEVAAASSVIGTDPATVSFDSSSQTLSLLTEGGATVDFNTPDATSNGFLIYNINDAFARLAETEDDGGFVILAAGDVQDGIATQEIRRLGVTNLPTVGTVIYTGNYASLIVPTGTTDPFGEVTGNVTLNVDFAAAEVDGTISERTYEMTVQPDVTFQLGALDTTGAFSGDIDQATLTGSSSSSTGTGSYTGLITGSGASSAVGTVTITYTGGNFDGATELGVFVVN